MTASADLTLGTAVDWRFASNVGRRLARPLTLLIDSTELPSGVGEVSVPSVAPALANAIAALTGTRILKPRISPGVAMARVLLGRPDVLLMDEPTNHLDIESIIWLEGFLKSLTGSLLMT